MKKIFNETKTRELTPDEIDLRKGHLQDDLRSIYVEEVAEVPDEGHYETIREYPETNGKDIQWVIDKPGQRYIPEHYETEEIQIYIPYTDDQLKALGLYEWSEEELEEQRRLKWNQEKSKFLKDLKQQLAGTDYHVLKYIEGLISDDEFNFWKIERQKLRDKINEMMSFTFEDNRYIFGDIFSKDKID